MTSYPLLVVLVEQFEGLYHIHNDDTPVLPDGRFQEGVFVALGRGVGYAEQLANAFQTEHIPLCIVGGFSVVGSCVFSLPNSSTNCETVKAAMGVSPVML